MALIMKCMTKFVRDGKELIERAIIVDQDARLLDSRNVHTKTPTPFAVTWFSVDPSLVKNTLGKDRQAIRIGFKLDNDEIFRLVIRETAIALSKRGKDIPPG
jgi:hypothetical protein